MTSWNATEGSPYPLGATYVPEEDAYNFAIYSKHATHVTLLIYDDHSYEVPVASFNLHYLLHKSHRIWHCRLRKSQLNGGLYYAYKIDGPDPEGPFEWHAFDREKVLPLRRSDRPFCRICVFPSGLRPHCGQPSRPQ